MKRANDPIFWLLFGAGGMLSALVGAALVFVTGIGAPLGFLVSRDLMRYERVLSFAQNGWGKLFLFAVIALFLWHAALRIYHMLHDFGIRAGAGAKLLCFGLPLLCTIAAAWWLLALGF
ncbi:MAG: fumarate reductase subunit FrdD [Betaproteobacteria bacterium]|nr:fumarate reductase subunit FrdD [Betaproteobacteria bacterium]